MAATPTTQNAGSSGNAIGVLSALMVYWGFTDAINAAAAPFLAREYGLGDAEIALTFGWTSLGALGTFALARAADKVGRRRVLLIALVALAPLCMATALASSLTGFIIAQIGVGGLKGVLVVVVPVMVTESFTPVRRSRAQGWVGMAGAMGSGLALLLVAACEDLPGTWRWAWGVAVVGIAAVPFVRRSLPESAHFERAAAAGETARARARDLLGSRYRRLSLGSVVLWTLFPLAISATQSWLIFYPVEYLGVEPLLATGLVIAGGSVGLAGFPIGGRLSESWGRRPTFAVAATLYIAASIAFYHVPADFPLHPGVGLGLSFAAMGFLSAAATVPLRAATTELFPTALRATLSGWNALAMASGVVMGYFATAGLAATVGGLPDAVSLLSLSLLIAALIFIWALPESRGLELETAIYEPPAIP